MNIKNMLVSFRQTYGDDRWELYDILSRDKRLIALYNLCDINIHSFHNCSKETIQRYKEINKIENSLYLEFNNITYLETIREVKNKLFDLKCTHFLFTQDDTFSIYENEDVNFEELLEYVNKFDKDFMLNLYNKNTILNPRDPDVIKETFNIYKSTTWDFYKSDRTPWPMDDTPYICTIDILDKIYDEEYFGTSDIWKAERLLRDRYKKKKNSINRFVTNKSMFRNYNLFGRTLFMETIFRGILRKNKLIV